MQTPLTDAIEGSPPRRDQLGARIVLGLLRGYKILISPLFTGSCRFQPSCADYMAEAVDRYGVRTRRLAGPSPSRALQAFWRPRVRSRPSNVDPLHGTQGFHRHLVVVCRALRLSGALRAAAETGDRRRREEGPPRPCRLPRQLRPSRPNRRATPEPAAQISEPSEREIVVETATSQVVLTNRGGRILHWRLKDYRDSAGALVDLVPSGVPPDQPKPFALIVDDDPALTRRLNSVLFRVSGDVDGRADAAKQAASLSFEYQDAAGLRVQKDFRFDPQNYVVVFSAQRDERRSRAQPDDCVGPGPERRRGEGRRRQFLHRKLCPAAAGDLSQGWRRRTRCRRQYPRAAGIRRAIPFRGNRRSLFPRCRRRSRERTN